jgi:hypothetical protein
MSLRRTVFVTTLSYRSAKTLGLLHSLSHGLAGALVVVLYASAAVATPLGPSLDEAWNAAVAPEHAYTPVMSAPSWIAPGPGLPSGVDLRPSNNNVAVANHEGRIFVAWRSSRTHFASSESRLYVVSTAHPGQGWTFEAQVALGRDVREPFLLSVGPRLFLYFAELGTDAGRFEPGALWRMERLAPGRWSEKERWGGPAEVAWDFKVRQGRVWMTSYRGDRYQARQPQVALRFRWSPDGVVWNDTPAPDSTVYRGGVSEAAFEFDAGGTLWAVTRNEDGDDSGFGSHLVWAPAGRPWDWQFPARSDPARYDSPRLLRHGNDLYLIARRDPESVFDRGFSAWPQMLRRLFLLACYSLRPKRTTLYHVDTAEHRLVPLFDLPSAGDTAFPSIARLGPHEFLVANYTSPLDMPQAPWIAGQVSPRGTAVYAVMLRFVPS